MYFEEQQMQMLEERVAQQDDELAQMERRLSDTLLAHFTAVTVESEKDWKSCN